MIQRIYGSTDNLTITLTGLGDIGKTFATPPEDINDIIFELRTTNDLAETPIWTKTLGVDITTSDPDVIIAWDAGDYTNLIRGRRYYGRLAIKFDDATGTPESYYRTISSDADVIEILANDITILDPVIDSNFDITGLLEAGNWIPVDVEGIMTIKDIDVEAIEGCADCGWSATNKVTFTIDLNLTSSYYTINGDVIEIEPAAFSQTSEPLSDGVYTLILKVNVWDGVNETENYTSYSVCQVVDTALKCDIAEIIEKNLTDEVLVPMWTALTLAKECGDCCSLCSLYSTLKEKVSTYGGSTC